MSIKDKLKSMKCMEGIIMLRRFYHSADFKQLCNNYYDAQGRVLYYTSPDQNVDKLVLQIPVYDVSAGFFCNYLFVLRTIRDFGVFGLPIVVNWMGSPYCEPGSYKGTDNPFEYYFEPISGITLSQMRLEFQPVDYNNLVVKLGGYETQRSVEYWKRLADVNRKCIRLRGDVKEQLTFEINQKLNGKKTLGVHARKAGLGQIKGHPIPVEIKEYITYIDEALEKYGFEQIFLASDSEDTVVNLREHYGEKLVCFDDVLRTQSGSGVLVIFDRNVKREHNQYRMGYEVLRDACALSCCDGFIGGMSDVAYTARVFKMSQGRTFSYEAILKQQIKKDGISAIEAKKLVEKGLLR